MSDATSNGSSRKVWILAGEASGDLYGAQLATELLALQPDLVVQGMGAERMATAGVDILVDSSELGIVGFVEVIKHLPMFLKLFRGLVDRADRERPDVVVLIDYPGFNLRFARKMHALGIKVVYYISPQVWAWGKGRVAEMARILDRMIVIFPFEEKVFASSGLRTHFVGHPLVSILRAHCQTEVTRERDLVALLPGSRMSELSRLVVPLLETAARLYAEKPNLRFVIPLPNARLAAYAQREVLRLWGEHGTIPIEIVHGQTERIMRRATAGIAASGTVTVQAAILGLPLVVIYRINPLTCWLMRRMVSVKYITMVNLVAEELVFEEFIQSDVVPEKLVPALLRIMPEGERRRDVIDGMRRTVARLRGPDNPSRGAATIVLDALADDASTSA